MKQEWLKCDMHMHSQYSKSKDGSRVREMSAKDFVDILLGKDIKVFSITDHNIYSNKYYNEVKEYIKDKNIKIINGVEFDVYVDSGNNDFFQMGVYFDNNVDGSKLEEVVKKLYTKNKPKFVDILNEIATLDSKFIIVPEGDKARGITTILDKISPEEAKEINKYAMYKIFSAFDVRERFDTTSKKIWANEFYQKSVSFNNIVKDKTPEEIEVISTEIYLKIKDNTYEFSSEDIKKIYDYVVKYGNYFAYFTFSDWHNAELYEPHINNFIFGSIDLYFEAFELAVLDPISRIIKTTEYDVPIPSNILKRVDFKIKGKQRKIDFSPGLNVIIGKRGSGKSLLLAVIENLNDKKNKLLEKYKGLNIDDIKAVDYNDIELDSGQLSSLAVLRQDQIAEIYENPDLANENISKFFVEIEPYDMSYINRIISVAKKVVPYNKNYKNLTSILITLKDLDYYSFKKYPDIQHDYLITKMDNSLEEIDQIIRELNEIGINTDSLVKEKDVLEKIYDNYGLMLDKYKVVIDNNNERIEKIISKRNATQKVILEQRQNLEKILADLNNNFEILLNLKKLNYLLDNAKFDNPKVRKRRKGNYLFVTSYSIPENLIDIIWDKLTSTISKIKGDTNDIDLIIKYVNGDKSLKSGIMSITEELSKYIKDDVFKPKKGFYKISNSFDEKEIETYYDLIENIEKKNIEDLSKASPGMKSVAYLDMLFDLNEAILLFDQPEDNIDNEYISQTLVAIIKDKKKSKQLIFVTHNPSLAVYGDAFNYIYVENENEIIYNNYLIERVEDKENIMNILEGGKSSFVNRDKKYGSILGEEEYGNN